MRKEDYRQLKENLIIVQAGVPREPQFQITLADVLRLYGDYGTKEEIERCLKDLEKEGVLMKRSTGTYVFVNEIKKRLSNLNIENQKVIEERNQVSKELDGINKLQNLWLNRLQHELEGSSQLSVLKYFVSVYWQTKSKYTRQKLTEIETKGEKIKHEVYELKKTLGDL